MWLRGSRNMSWARSFPLGCLLRRQQIYFLEIPRPNHKWSFKEAIHLNMRDYQKQKSRRTMAFTVLQVLKVAETVANGKTRDASNVRASRELDWTPPNMFVLPASCELIIVHDPSLLKTWWFLPVRPLLGVETPNLAEPRPLRCQVWGVCWVSCGWSICALVILVVGGEILPGLILLTTSPLAITASQSHVQKRNLKSLHTYGARILFVHSTF